MPPPKRRLVFDANDFDETLRGPWEWDLKRLAASFLVAARYRGFEPYTCRTITARMVEAYGETMRAFGEMRYMQLWYEHTAVQDIHRRDSTDPEDLARRRPAPQGEVEVFADQSA
jgi:uncharacterized protein (DUF2252 family)